GGLSTLRYYQNEGKRGRHSVDQWDRQSTTYTIRALCFNGLTVPTVMDRDRRLTGSLRGQTDNPVAPPGFELNNPWRVEDRYY
ncbi:MAG: hypothetical protein LQ343_005740, partial [Gyalolechia ehrenbergii]